LRWPEPNRTRVQRATARVAGDRNDCHAGAVDSHARRALSVALVALGVLVSGTAQATAVTAGDGRPPFDVRDRAGVAAQAPEDPGAVRARERLEGRLGPRGILRVDAATGTPRLIARPGGSLTGPSAADPERVVVDYLRANAAVFGLSDSDLAGLRRVRRYADRDGTTYLVWAQTWRGIAAYGNDVHAAVAADGRLLTVSGSPVPALSARSATPRISAGAALAEALGDAGRRGLAPRADTQGGADRHTTFAGGHDARLVLFPERRGDVRLAWNVTARADADEVYDDVVDASSGELLYRRNAVDFASATLNVFTYAPGLTGQGNQTTLISGDDIQVTDGNALDGPYAEVYPDVNADDLPDGPVPASAGTSWTEPLVDKCAGPDPSAAFVCSWDDAVAGSWQANLKQSAAQAYFLTSNFHDWLELEPNIAFDAAAGNFEGSDRVRVEILDGADKGTAALAGRPDSEHLNNASMTTARDGQRPLMQLFLFADRVPPVTRPYANASDDASVVYHEYAHGLSNRSVTTATGAPGLGTDQSEAMGEAWSDWYAFDYLVQHGLDADTAAPGELILGRYLGNGVRTFLRSEPIDCPVGSSAPACPGRTGPGRAGPGGYTFGDYGRIFSAGTEEHFDGEIWGQTLWDIRRNPQIGPAAARRVITTGMRLSPPDPSMIDMRDAILLAETDPTRRAALWETFAARGFGFFAQTRDGDDKTPTESFVVPPPPGTGGTVRGRVTDRDTGAPVQGALVQLPDVPGDLTAVTGANGDYSIDDAPPGTYPRMTIDAPGHDPVSRPSVAVAAEGAIVDATLRRDHAAAASGATVAALSPDHSTSAACGAGKLIDLDYGAGWSSSSHNADAGPQGPKSVTIALAAPTDVTAFGIDPSATCAHGRSASTGDWRAETSSDGIEFTEAAAGTFAVADNDRLNEVEATARRNDVRYVRFTMLTPQRQRATGGDGAGGVDSGRQFMDATEFEVYGVPAGFGRPPADDPPATAEPAPVAPVDGTAPVARVGVVAGQRLAAALRRGFRATLTCDEPCSASLALRLDATTAKRLGLLSRRSRARFVTVAGGSLRLGEGRRGATLRFTARARKRLARRRSIKLSLAAVVRDGSGNTSNPTRRITLKR
jgi:extracellular elastinolytic metalloproteinase